MYANYRLDFDRALIDEQAVIETWKKQKAANIASAYALFVKPMLHASALPATTKATMLAGLQERLNYKYTQEGAAAAAEMDV